MGELVSHVCGAAQKLSSLKSLGVSKKVKAMWSMRDAKANGEARASNREMSTQVPQAQWEAHMKKAQRPRWKKPQGALKKEQDVRKSAMVKGKGRPTLAFSSTYFI